METTTNTININSPAIDIYRNEMLDALKLSFPAMYESDLIDAINYSIAKRSKDSNCVLDNNYTKKRQDTTLFKVLEYIIDKEPIITVAGVMFKKHGSEPNPYVDLIQSFLKMRGVYKNEMFKYPKGSDMFEKYNLLQLSEKVSANAIYGASGMCTSVFYNLYVAQSVTMQGQSCISTAIMLFESFMANNVKFGSLNEAITFINNIRKEKRTYMDYAVIDRDITVQECFMQVVSTFGFYYIPTEKDMMIIWDILNKLPQQDINRIFYKNNLFNFVDNRYVMNKIIEVLSTLKTPFMDPNDPPEEIKDSLGEVYDLLKEWVYYDQQYMDRIDRAYNMYRCVSVLTDTDSCFISFDGWYRYILDKIYNIPMRIKEIEMNEDTGEVSPAEQISYDYDFYKDEIIELKQTIRPNIIGPGVGFRCSIINILAYTMGKLSIDYMYKYSTNSNATTCADGSKRASYYILKNEFQLKRALVTDNKKNYCSYQERQEASIIPAEKALDIKGMPIRKVGIPKTTRHALESILFDCILNAGDNISQVEIVKRLAILEKRIYNSIMAGDKEFFKPVRIKSMAGYDDPMGQFGIKASVAYNELRDANAEPIDLEQRNSILVVKTDITDKNVDIIKDTFPYQYEKMTALLNDENFKKGITKIALPENIDVPEWIKLFINFNEIINDNLKTFPSEAVGIDRLDKDSVNYTNIIRL